MNRLVQKRFKGASQMKKPSEIKQLFKGYSFILACRGFIEYIFSESKGSNDAEIGGVAKDFLKWCEHTEHPDEHFFNTLNHQSHLNIPGSYLGILQSMLFSFQVIVGSQLSYFKFRLNSLCWLSNRLFMYVPFAYLYKSASRIN